MQTGQASFLKTDSATLFASTSACLELLGTEMPRLIERLKTFQGEIISVSEPRFADKAR
jgi:hypothetical protein